MLYNSFNEGEKEFFFLKISVLYLKAFKYFQISIEWTQVLVRLKLRSI